MLEAFDTLLEAKVSSYDAAKNSRDEFFRYECAYCGEEVFLAARDSEHVMPHFRHRSGNNEKECEFYSGQGVTIEGALKKKNNRIDFYYNNSNKCFYFGLKLTKNEIVEYDKYKAILEVYSNKSYSPFFKQEISLSTFSEGVLEKFILEEYASKYYICNTFNNINRTYTIFNEYGPSFYKVLNEDTGENNFWAKYVWSNLLYTNTRYLIIWPGQNTAQIRLSEMPGVCVEKAFSFYFNKYKIWAVVVTFNNKTMLLDNQLNQWGFYLKTSEKVTILWPPAYSEEEKIIVSSSTVYLYSTFDFQGKGNVNIDNRFITKNDSIMKVSMDDELRIVKNNVEMTIKKVPFEVKTDAIETIWEEKKCFVVPPNNAYYYFSSYGVEKLYAGQKIFLTPKTHIVEYKENKLTRLIFFALPQKTKIEEQVNEALSNYFIMEKYDEQKIKIFPKSMIQFLKNCKKDGMINKAVSDVLREGE